MVTVSLVGPFASAANFTDVGANAHVAPMGKNPEQEKETDPLNAAFAVMVRVTDPVPL